MYLIVPSCPFFKYIFKLLHHPPIFGFEQFLHRPHFDEAFLGDELFQRPDQLIRIAEDFVQQTRTDVLPEDVSVGEKIVSEKVGGVA